MLKKIGKRVQEGGEGKSFCDKVCALKKILIEKFTKKI